jgi:alanyl-tRNA synthetase
VARTGAIGLIAVLSWERFKGGQRIEFVCGGRALNALRRLRNAAHAGSRLLSVLPHDIPGAIERLQHEARELKKSRSVLATELAGYQAETCAAAAEVLGQVRAVVRVIEGDAVHLKTLASAIVERPGFVAVLVTAATPASLVVSRSADVTLSSQAVVAATAAAHAGRGGGKPDLAQAGGLQGDPAAIAATARAEVAKLLP